MGRLKKRKRSASQTRFVDCDVCGAAFTTKRSHTSTCGPKCRQAKRRASFAANAADSPETRGKKQTSRVLDKRKMNRPGTANGKRDVSSKRHRTRSAARS